MDTENTKTAALVNPFNVPFKFMYDSRKYVVPPKGEVVIPEPLARHAAKLIAEKVLTQNGNYLVLLNKTVMEREMAKYVKEQPGLTEIEMNEDGEEVFEELGDGFEDLNSNPESNEVEEESEEEDAEGETEESYDLKTKKELQAIADGLGVTYTDKTTKADLIADIQAAEQEDEVPELSR